MLATTVTACSRKDLLAHTGPAPELPQDNIHKNALAPTEQIFQIAVGTFQKKK